MTSSYIYLEPIQHDTVQAFGIYIYRDTVSMQLVVVLDTLPRTAR